MNVLLAPIEDYALGEETDFSADESSSQTALSVSNAQGFSADDYVVVGRIGHESAELKKISSVDSSASTITLTESTSFAHEEGEPIRKIYYNQRKFYRASSKTGTYSHLSSEGSPVDIEVDKREGTYFEDSTGTSSSWYKATYYNSTTSTETSTDDATPTKAGEADHHTSIYAIKRQAGLEENANVRDALVSDLRDEAENEFDAAIANVYSLPLSSTPKIARNIINNLAGGKLLIREYGPEASGVGTAVNGKQMVEEARYLIGKIVDGSLRLIDDDGDIMATASVAEASGSNVHGGSDESKGECFTLEDERFRPADPETGEGSTY